MAVSTCDTVYLRLCVGGGFCRACECSKSYSRVLGKLERVHSWLLTVQGALRQDPSLDRQVRAWNPRYRCVFTAPVTSQLGVIVGNLGSCVHQCHKTSMGPRDCPERIYCDYDAIARLYMHEGETFKNPDILLVASTTFTLIIEEKKKASSPSRSEFIEQLQSSYDLLPEDMKRNRCVFLALIPERGGLPVGIEVDRKTRLLRRKGLRGALLYPPTIYLYGVPRRLDLGV